ncbi:sister chromatid cohesion 1 protein 2-like isoform X1 [Pistacia vera]|uniref:sister chromatid cohesion 1 protein 2-like isoform X1 n=1 Tax=Pistacia vera TaxID=55513 RepID=UPI001263264A|nr:sister chromatid cohesion 1 protein 2-like isoform X1 [Pistacia vera]
MAVDPGTPSRSEQMAVAPETPILQLVATTPSLGSLKNSHLDTVIPAQSFQITEKGPSSSKGQGFNPTLITEEANLFDEDDQELHEFSARTRTVAGYLHRSFQYHKNRSEDEAVNLSLLLEGKTKKESARLFYEILVCSVCVLEYFYLVHRVLSRGVQNRLTETDFVNRTGFSVQEFS